MECKHYEGEGYMYDLEDDQLYLCRQCNMNLAMKLMEQLAINVFSSDFMEEEE